MNWDQIDGKWKQRPGNALGQWDQLVGKVRENTVWRATWPRVKSMNRQIAPDTAPRFSPPRTATTVAIMGPVQARIFPGDLCPGIASLIPLKPLRPWHLW